MKYIILEMQSLASGEVATLINAYDNKNEAESKYHAVLSAAAISKVPMHCAFMLINNGRLVKSECYAHESEAE